VDVILDDRDERPGVKFKDSELVGFPIRIGIGEKSLAKGEVELKPRGGALQPVKADAVVEAVMKLLEDLSKFDPPRPSNRSGGKYDSDEKPNWE